jgi:hypothetical protein
MFDAQTAANLADLIATLEKVAEIPLTPFPDAMPSGE